MQSLCCCNFLKMASVYGLLIFSMRNNYWWTVNSLKISIVCCFIILCCNIHWTLVTHLFFFFLVRIFILSRLARYCLSACVCYFNNNTTYRDSVDAIHVSTSSFMELFAIRGNSGHFSRDRFSFLWAAIRPAFFRVLFINRGHGNVNFEKGAFRFSFRVLVSTT